MPVGEIIPTTVNGRSSCFRKELFPVPWETMIGSFNLYLSLRATSDPITASKTPEKGFPSITENKGVKVLLEPGDMLVYKGNLCEHWREAFEGEDCGQVFLHYNNAKTKGAEDNIYDGRPHVGLPAWFRGKAAKKA